MTMRYAHLAPEREQLAVDRLVLSDVLVPKSAPSDQPERAQDDYLM
jgi:hypothetical protein